MTSSEVSRVHVSPAADPDASLLPPPHSPLDSGGNSTPIRTPSRSGSDPEHQYDSPDRGPPKWRSDGGSDLPRREHLENHRAATAAGEEDDDDSLDGADATVLELDPVEMSSWTGQPSIRGSTETMRMILLAFSNIGITFTWGIEMTYCTPYLLNLGLTKSNTSLVWVAGPLSGLIVQPIIGVIADQSKSRWGRRRPFIVVGTIIVAFSLMTLGFTKEIVGIFIPDEEKARSFVIVLAVLSIYAVDFAINAVMSCARSLVVDTLPIEKQQLGAAWGGRMSSIGHMMGYGAGALDLVSLLGTTLGDTQFKQLSVIATFSMLFSSAVTCWAVTERVLVSTNENPHKSGGFFKVFRQIWSTLRTLPPRIQAICWAQFWSWIGWFPFLFYSTTWVGETYFRYDVPEDAKESKDVLGDIGRIGSTALVIYSVVTFLGAWLLPLVVKSPDDEKFTARPPQSVAPFLEKFARLKPSLINVWIAGHIMFAASMCLAPFATSFRFATFLVVFCGLPWTIAMWAPTTFLGVEVNKLSGATENSAPAYRRLSDADDSNIEMSNMGEQDRPLHLEHGPDHDVGPVKSTGELSGVYFGILNIYTTLPQFIATFISAIVFAILEPGKSPELAQHAPASEHHDTKGPNAISVCLFIGAICAVGAAFATRKLKHI